jgi:4'-phosphopantetheinyl transferase
MNQDVAQGMPAPERLPVHFWLGALPLRGDTICAAPDVFIIAVRTDAGQQRARARLQIREAIRATLSQLLDIDADAITLPAAHGSAPQIMLARSDPYPIGLSISHESALSLAAINLRGAIGVDLMQVQELDAGWEAVAGDYLGPATAQALATTAVGQRASAFASAWTAREASLKCLGMALQECTPLALPCQSWPLALPAGYAGSVALRRKRLTISASVGSTASV